MAHSRPYDVAADELWKLTKTDWHANVSYVLTEPVCAMVDIFSDDTALPTLRGFIGNGDVNDSIKCACEHMLETLRNTK